MLKRGGWGMSGEDHEPVVFAFEPVCGRGLKAGLRQLPASFGEDGGIAADRASAGAGEALSGRWTKRKRGDVKSVELQRPADGGGDEQGALAGVWAGDVNEVHKFIVASRINE